MLCTHHFISMHTDMVTLLFACMPMPLLSEHAGLCNNELHTVHVQARKVLQDQNSDKPLGKLGLTCEDPDGEQDGDCQQEHSRYAQAEAPVARDPQHLPVHLI